MLKKKTYIIILNYNGYLDTIECLESVLKQKNNNYQVIVIDNSDSNYYIEQIESWCTGNFLGQIETLFPEIIFPLINKPIEAKYVEEEFFFNNEINEKVVLVKAESNKGFAAGNNIALEYSKKFGENDAIIWLLNNDTVVCDTTLNDILIELNNHEADRDLTLFGTPLLEYYASNKIQAIGGKYNKIFALTSHVGEGMEFNNNLNVNQFSVDYPIGASMIVTNQYLKTIGLLSEDYFLFFEELDWALRLKAKEGHVKILNVFGVYHKQGGSTKTKTNAVKDKSEFIDLLSIKNRILFTKKYYRTYIVSVMFFILAITVPKRMVFFDFKRGIKILKLVFKEVFSKTKT